MNAYEFFLALTPVQWFFLLILAYVGMWTFVGVASAIADAMRRKP